MNNLITLCKTCHDKVHRGELTVRKRKERSYNLSDIGIVGSMKTQLMQRLKEILPTYGTTGSWTAFNRKRNHIEKSLKKREKAKKQSGLSVKLHLRST